MTTPTAEDLRQIHNLLVDYGATIDEGRWEEHLELWTEDAELVVFGRIHRGRDALDRFMRSAVRGKHVTAVPRLDFEGDRAHGSTDYVFYRASDLALFTSGVYRDLLVRTNGGWRLARRQVEIQLRRKE
jgi:3-phenylpropionate/cinnamic acid dioxygenase small subunit